MMRLWSRIAITVFPIALCVTGYKVAHCGEKAPLRSNHREIDFGRDVYPILRRSCFECHGAQKQDADLRLDLRTSFQEAGIVEPLRPGDSELLRRIILPRGDDEAMPAIGDSLPPHEVEVLQRWIEQGAVWPAEFHAAQHWAYQAPQRAPLPWVANPAWSKSELDRFVLSQLADKGLSPSPPAKPETLVRRLFLDLIGVPPSPAEVEAFLKDRSGRAIERLVDDLLARPQFGERWARHWLDLARYADSHGFQRDDWRQIWAYRDWVVQSMNDDMPFDRFTIEQIAGDLLPAPTESQRTATGFHRCTPTNVEAGSLPEETRIEQVIDRVNTTGAVWLGTTLECAQCHDHKFDPVTMKDYYRLLAFFNSSELEADLKNPKVPSSIGFQGPSIDLTNPAREHERRELAAHVARLRQQQAERRQELAAELRGWAAALAARMPDVPRSNSDQELVNEPHERTGKPQSIDQFRTPAATRDAEPIPANIAAKVSRNPQMWTENDRSTLIAYLESQDKTAVGLADEITECQKKLEQLAPETTLVMVELGSPRRTSQFLRGDYRSPGEAVEPGTPEFLHEMVSGPNNRLSLAQWLVDPANPLVARVTVNRWWSELFGRGIVETVEDFGTKGASPTHPQLLDWLAVEFVESGWSMKHLLRTIVLSATYQQSSRVTPQLLAIDDRNRLLARGPRFRMDAEMIRDNALAISGLLNLKSGGPPIRPYQPDGVWAKIGGTAYDYVVSPGNERHRRGIYVVLKRGVPYPSFVNFDASARLSCTVRRSRTNTPLQALTLLNDPVYVEAAKALVTRVLKDQRGEPFNRQLEYAFQLCTARRPTDAEQDVLRVLFDAQQAASKESNAATDELTKDVPNGAEISANEFAAWYAVATTLLNMHETITKE